jgi:D-3-phosphoglycerate dehydrogenase / 2-oxoglutarate reductase
VSGGLVVLLDEWCDVGEVERACDGLGLTVERRAAMPADPAVVGLVAGPDVPVGAPELAGLPALRVVATPSTGFDHLDLDALAAAGVWATNVSGYCDDEVAAHAIAMAVDLLRGVTLLDRSVRAGAWDYHVAFPRRIAQATLGVVGFGRIGRVAAGRGGALGMRVVAYDAMVPAEAIDAAGVEPCATLADLMAQADVVTLHAALTEATRGLIDAAALAALRPGSFLVNCSRAGLIDMPALGAALESGHLAGCALDVLPTEPPARGEPALTWPRTVINPHAAWASDDSIRLPYVLAADAVAAVLRGGEPARDVIARPRA